MIAYRIYRGDCYWPRYEDAATVAARLGLTRIIHYGRGWAIQKYVSGPYVGPADLSPVVPTL